MDRLASASRVGGDAAAGSRTDDGVFPPAEFAGVAVTDPHEPTPAPAGIRRELLAPTV